MERYAILMELLETYEIDARGLLEDLTRAMSDRDFFDYMKYVLHANEYSVNIEDKKLTKPNYGE